MARATSTKSKSTETRKAEPQVEASMPKAKEPAAAAKPGPR